MDHLPAGLPGEEDTEPPRGPGEKEGSLRRSSECGAAGSPQDSKKFAHCCWAEDLRADGRHGLSWCYR